jgi:hypothetical protein
MPLSLTPIPAGSTSYPAIVQANWDAIESFCNQLASQILAAAGDGADLILDVFDRPGLVGSTSYVLDLENYAGGAEIDIGHRPTANPALGEQDTSIAWGIFGGQRARVVQNEDVTLNAGGIIAGLPKTIYVGIPSDGTAQLFEDNTTPNVLYIYSMCWNGFSLTEFKRLAPILPGYSLLQRVVAAPREVRASDEVTDFLEHDEARTILVTPGDAADNEIGVHGSREILGFFVHFPQGDEEGGLWAPAGEDNKLTLKIQCEGEDWTEEFELDASIDGGNFVQVALHADVADKRYATEAIRFKLVKVSIGGDVVSAGSFDWGYYWRPMIGTEIPVDTNEMDLI